MYNSTSIIVGQLILAILEVPQQEIKARGIFGEYEFYKILEEYFNNKVTHSLNSTNILNSQNFSLIKKLSTPHETKDLPIILAV